MDEQSERRVPMLFDSVRILRLVDVSDARDYSEHIDDIEKIRGASRTYLATKSIVQ